MWAVESCWDISVSNAIASPPPDWSSSAILIASSALRSAIPRQSPMSLLPGSSKVRHDYVIPAGLEGDLYPIADLPFGPADNAGSHADPFIQINHRHRVRHRGVPG